MGSQYSEITSDNPENIKKEYKIKEQNVDNTDCVQFFVSNMCVQKNDLTETFGIPSFQMDIRRRSEESDAGSNINFIINKLEQDVEGLVLNILKEDSLRSIDE